jgi:hypothetical protein
LILRSAVGVVLCLLWMLWPWSMPLVWDVPPLLRTTLFVRDLAW